MTHEEFIKDISERLSSIGEENQAYFGKHTVMVPSRYEVVKLVKRIQSLMFPDYFAFSEDEGMRREEILDEVFIGLKRQLTAS